MFSKKVSTMGTFALVCLCFAFVFLTDLPQFLKYKKGDIKEFETVAEHELKKGDLVQGVIDFTDGYIAEMETTNKTFGVTTSKETTSRYYAVSMYNGNYILYETGNDSQYTKLDRLADECQEFYESMGENYDDFSNLVRPTTTLEFTGVVKSIPSDLSDIFEEWYGEGFDTECEKFMITNSNFTRLGGLVIVGVICAVLGIALLVLTVIAWRKEKNAALDY